MTHPDSGTLLTTRTAFRFLVRPARPGDDGTIRDFFDHVGHADLRFRFLAGVDEVTPAQISMLAHPCYKTDSFLAFREDGSTMIASAMLACDDALDRGEVAIAIREDHKDQGIGWALLSYIARHAETIGLRTLEAIESRDNHAALEVERDLGFVASAYPGDPALVLVSRSLGRR